MNRNITVAAAVAAALYGSAAFAQAPTLSQITSSSAQTINIMGSSAIKNALVAEIENDFCGGTYTPINTGANAGSGNNANFIGISCVPGAKASNTSAVYNVFIRYEGGSVSGYLPIANGIGVKEISGSSLTTLSPTINGASTGNGMDDSFSISGGSFAEVIPDLGIGDVEPAALINNNYPSAYVTSVWGPRNDAGLFSLKSKQLVDEVYALFVNTGTTGETFIASELPLNLSLTTVQNILTHKLKNWSQVFDINGNAVVSAPLAITIVDREAGSGSRAATDILIVGDGCGTVANNASLYDPTAGAVDYFSTGDVLGAANTLAGAITYATIDQSKGNLTQVALNGVTPSNLAAAQGTYPFWVEAEYVNNAANTGADSVAINNIVTGLQAQATTSALADIDVIPLLAAANGSGTLNSGGHLNPAGHGVVPSGGGGTSQVYINPYTRGGHACAYPAALVTTP